MKKRLTRLFCENTVKLGSIALRFSMFNKKFQTQWFKYSSICRTVFKEQFFEILSKPSAEISAGTVLDTRKLYSII